MSRQRQANRGGLANMSELEPITQDADLVRTMYAEFLGTFFVVYVGLGAVYISAAITSDVVTIDRLLMISLAYGFAYGSAMYALSFPSSDKRVPSNTRHLNPALTVSLFASMKISPGHLLMYLLSQFVGGSFAVLMIWASTPLEKRNITTAYPQVDSVNPYMTWLMEVFVSYISLLVILMSSFGHLNAQAKRQSHEIHEQAPQSPHEINCILAGVVVFVCSSIGGPVSGGYMNPLFPMGISILSDAAEEGPFLAPFVGGAFAILTAVLFGEYVPLWQWLKQQWADLRGVAVDEE